MAQPLAGAELGFIGAQLQPGQHHISKRVKKIESGESWSFDFICSFLLVLSDIQLLDQVENRKSENLKIFRIYLKLERPPAGCLGWQESGFQIREVYHNILKIRIPSKHSQLFRCDFYQSPPTRGPLLALTFCPKPGITQSY